jgi:hypothetical protein
MLRQQGMMVIAVDIPEDEGVMDTIRYIVRYPLAETERTERPYQKSDEGEEVYEFHDRDQKMVAVFKFGEPMMATIVWPESKGEAKWLIVAGPRAWSSEGPIDFTGFVFCPEKYIPGIQRAIHKAGLLDSWSVYQVDDNGTVSLRFEKGSWVTRVVGGPEIVGGAGAGAWIPAVATGGAGGGIGDWTRPRAGGGAVAVAQRPPRYWDKVQCRPLRRPKCRDMCRAVQQKTTGVAAGEFFRWAAGFLKLKPEEIKRNFFWGEVILATIQVSPEGWRALIKKMGIEGREGAGHWRWTVLVIEMVADRRPPSEVPYVWDKLYRGGPSDNVLREMMTTTWKEVWAFLLRDHPYKAEWCALLPPFEE